MENNDYFDGTCESCEEKRDVTVIAGQNLCSDCVKYWNQCTICKEHFPYEHPDDNKCSECNTISR